MPLIVLFIQPMRSYNFISYSYNTLMKTSIKILIKLGLLALVILISPFLQGIHAAMNSINFEKGLFTQQSRINTVNVSEFAMIAIVRKEDIPFREIDTEILNEVEVPPIKNEKKKSIYIYSTHQKEGYKDRNTVVEASQYLAQLLRSKGYEVIVEESDFTKSLNEQGLDYNDSYLISRNAIEKALKKHQGFDLMIDFHRDSLPRETTYTTINGKKYAKLMIVMGGLSDYFIEHQKNAVTLLDKTNQVQSGIMKSPLVREAYYNQDIAKNMLLIEVGSDQNYYEEITNSVNILAQSIDEMMR